MFGREPILINRSVVVVRPRQPYIDWANSMDDGGPLGNLEDMRQDPPAYLVDNVESREDLSRVLDFCWEPIFEEQLGRWMRDPDVWPKQITREIFVEWFDCELYVMVWDVVGTQITELP